MNVFVKISGYFVEAPFSIARKRLLFLALIFCLPGLFAGFQNDDFWLINRLKEDPSVERAATLYNFYDAKNKTDEYCCAPWWTNPELKFNFFRPLSGLALGLQYKIFGDRPFFFHALSILLFLAVLYGWSDVLRKFVDDKTTALSILIFTISFSPPIVVMWAANQNALIAACFFVFGFLFHLKWRDCNCHLKLLFAVILYALTLYSAEVGVVFLAYPLFYELYFLKDRPLKSRLAVSSLLTALVAVYFYVYKIGNFGTYGAGLYISPIGEFFRWTEAFGGRFRTLVSATFLQLYIDPWALNLRIQRIYAIVGSFGFLVLLWLFVGSKKFFKVHNNRVWTFFVVSAVATLVPLTSGFPMNRMLFASFLGASVVVALVLQIKELEAGQLIRMLQRYYKFMLMVVIPLYWIIMGVNANLVGARNEKAFLNRPDIQNPKDNLFIFGGFIPTLRFMSAIQRYHGQESAATFNILTQTPYDHEIKVMSGHSLEVTFVEGSALESADALLNYCGFYKAGDEVQDRFFTVKVLEVTSCGPKKFSVTFNQPLDELRPYFFFYDNKTIVPLVLPAVGETKLIKLSLGV